MQLKNMLRYKMNWARPTGPDHEVALSSRIRIARNLAGHLFPQRADKKGLKAVLSATFKASEKSGALGKAARIRLDAVDPLDRLFLVERHLVSNLLASVPHARGVVVGDGEVLSLMVNEEDHLRLQGIDSGLCLESLLGAVGRLDDELAAELKPAFDSKWGYLASCPTNTGTGLRASCLVHLPGLALTGEINRVLDGLSRLGVVARGLYGEGTKVMGDFYQISNAAALGPPEEEIAAGITHVVQSLISREKEARKALLSGQKTRSEDLVYRSRGVLSSARMISFEETMQHLSYIRMGTAMGLKLGTDLKTINELLVLIRPAHIQMLAGKELPAGDRDFLRATLLRRKFKT